MTDDGDKRGRQGEVNAQDQGIQDLIGRSLRAHFDDIVASPMPDRFLVLLSELESKEAAMAAGQTGSGAASSQGSTDV